MPPHASDHIARAAAAGQAQGRTVARARRRSGTHLHLPVSLQHATGIRYGVTAPLPSPIVSTVVRPAAHVAPAAVADPTETHANATAEASNSLRTGNAFSAVADNGVDMATTARSPLYPKRRMSGGSVEEFSWQAHVLAGLRKAPATTPPQVWQHREAMAKGKTGLSLLAQLLSPPMRVAGSHGVSPPRTSPQPRRTRMSPAGSDMDDISDSEASYRTGMDDSMSDMTASPPSRPASSTGVGRSTPAGGDSSGESDEAWTSPRVPRKTKRARGGRSPPISSSPRKGLQSVVRRGLTGTSTNSAALLAAATAAASQAGGVVRGTKTNTKASGGSRTRKFTSTFHGVSWHKRSQRWAVQIRNNGKRIHVGYFNDELQAALAYDKVRRRCSCR